MNARERDFAQFYEGVLREVARHMPRKRCRCRFGFHRYRPFGGGERAPSGWPTHVVCVHCGHDALRYYG